MHYEFIGGMWVEIDDMAEREQTPAVLLFSRIRETVADSDGNNSFNEMTADIIGTFSAWLSSNGLCVVDNHGEIVEL